MRATWPRPHGFNTPARRLRTLLCASLLFTASIPCIAQTSIRVGDPAGSLIVSGGGKKSVTLLVAPSADAGTGTLTVRVLPYDQNGRIADVPLASYQRQISDMSRENTISIPVATDRPGLARIDSTLTTADGATRGHMAVDVAVVQERKTIAPPDFGVVTHFAQNQGSPAVVLPLVRQAGFSWIRDELYWDAIEKTPGEFRFPKQFDTYISACAKLGISPLAVLSYGNRGAYPALFSSSLFPESPEARARFVRYVDAVVERYGKTVKSWEVWNEPDFNKVGYTQYLDLLKDTYRTIKQRSPDSTVISCGGGGAGGGPGADCMVALIKNGGLNDQDGFSVHPYMPPNTPEKGYKAVGAPIDAVSIPTTWPYLKQFAADHVKADGRQLQVWVTELGWPVNPKVPGQDEATEAANLARSYLLSRRYATVRVLFWYDFIDDGPDPNNPEHNFGILRHDLSPKPAFVAASVLSSTLGNRSWSKTLVDTDDTKAYQYGTDSPVIAGWTIGPDERIASISVPAGNYIQRDWQGIETRTTITSQPFSWRVGPLPRYLVPARSPQ
ncbi:beta-glucosidase [Paraburkholderia sp. GAS42]|jgi:hypothetical protein|uniref:beta-glucosidase n=1 Tax=Paraburkholderia sp. GAS42 TaxID=3035135 RepID=UPI003D25D493